MNEIVMMFRMERVSCIHDYERWKFNCTISLASLAYMQILIKFEVLEGKMISSSVGISPSSLMIGSHSGALQVFGMEPAYTISNGLMTRYGYTSTPLIQQ